MYISYSVSTKYTNKPILTEGLGLSGWWGNLFICVGSPSSLVDAAFFVSFFHCASFEVGGIISVWMVPVFKLMLPLLCLSIWICSSCCSCCSWWRFISACVAWALMLILPCSAWASESASAAAAVAVDGVLSPSVWLEPLCSYYLVLPKHMHLLQLLQLLQLIAFYRHICGLSPHAYVTLFCLSIWICSSCCSCCSWWRFIAIYVAWDLMLCSNAKKL